MPKATVIDIRTRAVLQAPRPARPPTPATLNREERLAKTLQDMRGVCCRIMDARESITHPRCDEERRAKGANDMYRVTHDAIGLCNEMLVYMRRGPWDRRKERA